MKISLTKKQYKDLLISVLIGNYIRESVDESEGKDIKGVRDVEDYLLSLAKDFSADYMVENFEGKFLVPSDIVVEEYHNRYIDGYEKNSFWHNLVTRLGQRDFDKYATKEELDKINKDEGLLIGVIDKYYQKYESEFETRDIDRLEVNIMDEDLKKWHTIKSCLMKNDKKIFFHEREVWWCSIGKNIGFEQNGKGEEFTRPIVIIKRLSLDTCLAIPLTVSKKRKNIFPLGALKDENRESFAMIEQIRLFDAKRLKKKIDVIDKKCFNELVNFIKEVNFGNV